MSAIPTEYGAEWAVLLAACATLPSDAKQLRLRSLLATPLHWEHLFLLAERHGVQPLLCQALNSVRDALPAEHRPALERNYQANLHKSLLLSRELIRVLRHLRQFDVDVLPYKGPASAEFLYGDVALRQAGDIDLLVRREEFSRVEQALAKIGYAPQTSFSPTEQRAYLRSGYECVFDGPAGRNVLEVQWAIQPRFYSVNFDMDALFERAVKIDVAGQTMNTLSAADLLLVLAVHAAKHRWGRLIWICDLARLLSLPSLDWEWIASQATHLGVLRIVNISRLLAKRLLGAEVPAGARTEFHEGKIDAQIASQIARQVFQASSFNVESVSYFRLMMNLRERTLDRARFLTRLAFTPGPNEWKAMRLPPPLFPLYRVVRISRLLARLAGA
jgi:hypothetical protein